MGWNSVRVRLTLWNVLVLALVLGGFGTALCYTVQANQSVAIDRSLAARAHGFGRGFPGGHGPFRGEGQRRGFGGPFGPPPEGTRFPERRSDEPGRRPDGFHRGDPEGRPHRDEPQQAPDATTARERYFERPLLFDLQGKPGPRFPNDPPWDAAALKRALRGEEVYSTVLVNGERVRVLSSPVPHGGPQEGVMQVAHPLAEQQRLIESQVRTLLILLPLAVLVAGLGGLFLTNRALAPVRDVTHTAAQIGAEDLSRRLKVNGRDELAELARTFNGMIARLEGAFRGQERAHRELEEAYRKLESAYEEQRRFTGDASHELRTPLTRIKGSTSLALAGPHCADEYREALEVADGAADAMIRIVQDLLLLARSDAGQLNVRPRPVPVEELLHRAVSAFQDQPGARIELEPPPDGLEVQGDPDHLNRLFVNLIENAIRHTPDTGRITLSARRENGTALITVADTGEGIPPEHLSRVFERFYRVDASRTRGSGGTGLGLAICQSIVQAHGGTISVQSERGRGTVVSVVFTLSS